VPPIYYEIGPELVDQFRIESVWACGGSMNRCLLGESEAMVLARVAMGEAPHSLSDRVYVMWNIKLRAALGFKEALPGYLANPERWGPETSIYVEALCNGGCQYAPVRAADGIFFPCKELAESHALRPMLCPTDEQLDAFWWTYTIAEGIVVTDLSRYPEWLKGYDSFRSPQVAWYGTINRPGGLRSIQFFGRGNIWRDEYEQDNAFWESFDADAWHYITECRKDAACWAEYLSVAGLNAMQTPVPAATITPEPSWTPTATAHATLSVRADRATVERSPAPAVSKEDATDLVSFFAALVGTAVILFIGHLLGMRRASRRK
jgi:hypothetical protein